MQEPLTELASSFQSGTAVGITSVCSAHPLVIRAALRQASNKNTPVLIEATCNQVNHLGGYTGMCPGDFADLVYSIANEEQCPTSLIILGGDHLGPNPWRDQDADSAMGEAKKMIHAYVKAGFRKLHLDASMGCGDEPQALDDATTAERAAQLASVAEDCVTELGLAAPLYIIGTEVPPPGGADHLLTSVAPTAAAAARKTYVVHKKVFHEHGLQEAFSRVMGLVVQPGVEFGNHNIIAYDRAKASDLVSVLREHKHIIFEAHSTDYQGLASLSQLVKDGFLVLKVGPELTHVLREALYALDLIASDLSSNYGVRPLYQAMETAMIAEPQYWLEHYNGDWSEQRLLRHYSFSDRIRYYWADTSVQEAVSHLINTLQGVAIPLPLMQQHFASAVAFAETPLDPEALIIWRITQSLNVYQHACSGQNHDARI